MKSFDTHVETLNEILLILQFIEEKLWINSTWKSKFLDFIIEFEAKLNDFENHNDSNFEFVLNSMNRKLDEIYEILVQIKDEKCNDLKVRELKYFIGIIEIEIYNLNK